LASLILPAGASARGIQTAFVDPDAFAGVDGDRAAARMRGAGATSVRLLLSWNSVAPPSRPLDPSDPTQYNWSGFEAQVDRAVANGLTPIVYVVSAPAWAEGAARPASAAPGTWKPNPDEVGDFGKAAAAHFQGRVRHWELWNEPNLSNFLNPQYEGGVAYSPRHYRLMLNAFAAGVHSVDANNIVIAGSTAPYGGGDRVRPLRFMRYVLCLSKTLTANCSATAQFDAWSTHTYTHGGPTRHAVNADDVAIADLPDMRRVLLAGVRRGHVVTSSGIPRTSASLMVTEFSWDTRPPDTKGVPLSLHARWTSEALYRMWRARVTLATWYLLRDRPFPAELWQSGFYFCGAARLSDEASCGLSTASLAGDARKSGSHRAFRFPFVAFDRNGRVSVWGRMPPGTAGPVAIQRKTATRWRTVRRASLQSGGVFTKRWRSSWTSGYLRARLPSGEASLRFSLRQPPYPRYFAFGCGGTGPYAC
jgi:hypothetical protein